jgi:2,7-dihydroxy-5-methyl-1-naphthoate 7-O-methyltransferase
MPDDETWPSELFARADLVTPMALRVAATLRLADHVAAGATTAAELARRSGSDAAVLGRVLRHLSAAEVFTRDEDGTVGLGRLGRRLLSSDQSRARDWLDIKGAVGRADLALFGLLDTVVTGRAAYPAVYGRGFWEDLDGDPALAGSFNLLMGSQLGIDILELATSYDWAPVASVVDVGGGDGTLLSVILRAHPHLRGTLVEVPATAAAAKASLGQGDLADRCEVAAGSFFEALPAGGDAYLLSEVLHDWPDAEATAILRRCRDAAGPDGTVLVFEGLVDPDAAVSRTGMDLRMLAYMAGRERTLAELTEVAGAAGLAVAGVRPGGHRTLVELKPAAGD